MHMYIHGPMQVAALMESGKIVPTTLVQQLVVHALRSNASSSDGAAAHVLLASSNPNPNPAPNPDPNPSPNPSPDPDPNPDPGPNQVLPDFPRSAAQLSQLEAAVGEVACVRVRVRVNAGVNPNPQPQP